MIKVLSKQGEKDASVDTHDLVWLTDASTHSSLIEKLTKVKQKLPRSHSVRFGLLGEQGVESIHSQFNTLGRTFAPLAKGVERLRCQMKKHFIHINPQNAAARPPPAKRIKLVVQEE